MLYFVKDSWLWLALASVFCAPLLADGPHWLLVESDLPSAAVAGDSVQVELHVLVRDDNAEAEWESYEGPLEVWYLDAVLDEELGPIPQREYASFSVEIANGEGGFEWYPKVAGLQKIGFRLPEDGARPASSTVIDIAPGPALLCTVAQFEKSMLFMETDLESELAEWVTNGCTICASTTLFVTWYDEFGNVCPLGYSEGFEGSELELALECEDPEYEDWDLDFSIAVLEDDGFESPEEAIELGEPVQKHVETSEDDEDGLLDRLERLSFGQSAPAQVWSLTSFQPRAYAKSFYVRIIGTASSPPSSASLSFQLQFTMTGSIQGTAVSGSGTVKAQLGTLSSTIAEPYLTAYDNLLSVHYGTDHVYPQNVHWTGGITRRWAGTAAWWNMVQNTNSLDQQFNSQPGNTPHMLTEMMTRVPSSAVYMGLPGSAGTYNGGYREDMGAASSYGEFYVVGGSTWGVEAAWGSNHAQSTNHAARRGWKVEVAFQKTGTQPSHQFDGRLYRHSAGYSYCDSGSGTTTDASSHASWSVRGWGQSFDAASQSLTTRTVETRDGSCLSITGISLSVPAGIGINIEATTGIDQQDDQEQYTKSPYLISDNGLQMLAGFSVGWAAIGQHEGGGTFLVGWLDVVQVAYPTKPEPGTNIPQLGVIYHPSTLAQAGQDDAFVRVGYSAPGTGGIVWTSGKWLR